MVIGALAGLLVVTNLRAQTAPDAALFRPAVDGGPAAAPQFGPKPAITEGGRSRFVQNSYGNPPAYGAGATGFVSTNQPRRRKARNKVQAGGNGSAAIVAVPISTGIRVPPQFTRRAALDVAATTRLNVTPAFVPPRARRPAPITDPFEPSGFHTGAFLIKPAIELTGGYDSNPTHATGKPASSILIVAPELQVRSDWQRHTLNADIRGTYTWYGQTFGGCACAPDGSFIASGTPESLDRPTLDSRVSGRLDVTGASRVDMEGRLLVSTDNPGSPNIQTGLTRLPLVTTTGGTLGYVQRFNRFEIGAKGSVDRSIYQPSSLTDGTTSANDDRNFNQYGLALRGSYELTPGVKPFVEVGIDTRVHDLPVDRTGAERDSAGNSVKAGTTFEVTRSLTGELSAGYLTRRYEDPALPDLGGLTADASLVWKATALTTFTLTAKTAADEMIVAGVSGAFRRDFGLQVDHALRRWLLATVRVGFGVDDYVGSTREDNRYAASTQLTYKMTPTVWFKGEFRRDWLRSNVDGADFQANVVLLGVRLQR
jgi:hypothetical protein